MKKPNNLAAPPADPIADPSPGRGVVRELSPAGRGGVLRAKVGGIESAEQEAERLTAAKVAEYAREKGDTKGERVVLLGSPEEMHRSLIRNLEKVTAEPGPAPEDARFRGLSPVDFADLVIPDADTLLNDHFLDRGAFMLYVGSSGMGKSSSIAQMVVGLAICREVFGLVPARPLRVLVLQAEDSDYDLKKMFGGVLAGLQLTQEELDLLRDNARIETVNWAVGGSLLLEVILPLLDSYRPDILIINPFNAYLGAAPKDDEKVTWFLRTMLNPMLAKFGCAAIITHHTPKTNFQNRDDWAHSDYMYAAAGCADMVNAARAVLLMEATADPAVFKFRGAKRGAELGWTDNNGKPVYERYFAYAKKHDSGAGMYWVPATKEDIRGAAKKKDSKPTSFDRVLAVVDFIARSKDVQMRRTGKLVTKICERFGCSRRTAFTALSEAVEHGFLDTDGSKNNTVYSVTAAGLNKLQANAATCHLDDEEIEAVQANIDRDNPVAALQDKL